MWGHRRRSAHVAAALGVVVLAGVALAPAAVGVHAAGAAGQAKVVLPQSAPQIPSNAKALGAAPPSQVLNLDVTLAGQDPAGLAEAVAAVSTPGSPQYRHYLTAAQYAAEFGPSAPEVAQTTSVLRGEGLTVGTPQPGSTLLPVSGSVAEVTAAFSTPMETVQSPTQERALVNTAAPQIPASLSGTVTGVVGLDGLFQEHSMLMPSPSHAGPSAGTGSGAGSGAPTEQGHAVGHAGTPQACSAAQGQAFGGAYTSTELASVFGLNQLFGQGRTGVGQTIAIVEFEQYLQSDINAFESCYGLDSSIRNVLIDGGAPGPAPGSGEAALDIELASFNAPGASLLVYQAPNNNDAQALDLFNTIASQDAAQVVTTSWGNCEQFINDSDPNYIPSESQIFERMAMQGQTMIAASGDSGSEDCFPDPQLSNPTRLALAVDDPGSQPDVVSAGGTRLPSGAPASSQVVWNNCQGATIACAEGFTSPVPIPGAGGGGFSAVWGRPSFQNSFSANANRAVPDISFPSDPSGGGVAAFYDGGWTAFGGTSVAAPTNAGLFADINQGCFTRLGMVLPALYALGGSGNTNFTDIASGNNDFTDSQGGDYGATAGYDPASGLGTAVDQNLAPSLQGGDGCPSVASVSPNTGPLSGSGAITVSGSGFANATSVSFGSLGFGHVVSQSQTSISVIPPNAPGPMCVDITVANPLGVSASSAADQYGFDGDLNCGQGYSFVASDGGIFDFGSAGFFGSAGSLHLNAPVVGMAETPSTNGYWLVASDGGIFTYGDAQFFGSMGGQHLNKPIVGMAATPNGGGYWLVAADGGIFSYGNAQFFGSTGSMHLNKPIVGMASTPDGAGYWLVASDGGIFSYGNAQFHGSAGSLPLNSPVVGMAAAPGGGGYWLVAADGGIFDYGTAGFFGSAGSIRLNEPVVGMAGTPDGDGYWLVAADGGIFTYGDAQFFGSTGSIRLNKPIVGMSST
jgi:hypothetical protein